MIKSSICTSRTSAPIDQFDIRHIGPGSCQLNQFMVFAWQVKTCHIKVFGPRSVAFAFLEQYSVFEFKVNFPTSILGADISFLLSSSLRCQSLDKYIVSKFQKLHQAQSFLPKAQSLLQCLGLRLQCCQWILWVTYSTN